MKEKLYVNGQRFEEKLFIRRRNFSSKRRTFYLKEKLYFIRQLSANSFDEVSESLQAGHNFVKIENVYPNMLNKARLFRLQDTW